ncbi:MAG: tyrosine-type recombinase/integrase [Bacillota bacterium]|nr:tyrosine-type recombinase/integrase [Bacillota bacterium]
MDFELLRNEFFNYLTIELNRSPLTVKGYGKDLRVFIRYMQNVFQKENLKIDDISTEIVSEYLKFITIELHYQPRTVRRHLAALKSLYNFAVLQEYIEKNPAEQITAPKLPQRQPIYLEKNQALDLFRTVTPDKSSALRDLTILKTLFYSGLRVLELVSLKRQHIDLKENSLNVAKGKGDKQRLIPLHPELKKQLELYLDKGPQCDDGYLFCNIRRKGLTTEYIRQLMARCASEAGLSLKVTPHILRHSFATILYKNCGIDLKRLSQLLGHSSIRHTIVYAHSDIAHLRAAVEVLPSPGETGLKLKYKLAGEIDPRLYEKELLDTPYSSPLQNSLELEEVTERFLSYCEHVQNFSRSTCYNNRQTLNYFIAFLKENIFDEKVIKIKDVNSAHLRQFLHYLHTERKCKPVTLYTVIVRLKSFLKFAYQHGYIVKNPAEKIVNPKRPQLEVQYLKWEEVEKIFKAPDPADYYYFRDITLIKTMYYTGLRRDELSSLRIEDLNEDLSTLTVISGKGDKTRLIPIHSHLQETLNRYLVERKQLPASPYLFTTKSNKVIKDALWSIFMKHVRRTGISGKRVSPHIMRHTFATHLYQSGVDLKRISLLLGHVNINHTAMYTHTSLEHLHEAIKLL